MIVPSSQPLPFNVAARLRAQAGWARPVADASGPPLPLRGPVTRAAARPAARSHLALALGFFCFLPYPALPLGSATALQVGDVIAVLACLPMLFQARTAMTS